MALRTRKEPEIPEWLETLLLRQEHVLNRQEEIRAENEATREATHREEIPLKKPTAEKASTLE